MNDAHQLLVKLLLSFEGLRLKAYQDCIGVWTIGVGETLGVKPDMVWTKDYAIARLNIRALQFLTDVLKVCPQLAKESPARIAACGSLAYNIGITAFKASSVCRCTSRREYSSAADAFLLWNKAGGIINAGLNRRRIKERSIYKLTN